MRRELEKTSVVLSGAWNQAIFTPEWVAARILGQQEPKFHTVLALLATGGTMVEIAPLGKAALRLLPGRLEVRPLDPSDDALQDIERIAIAAAKALPETPLGAIGINFGYSMPGGNFAPLFELKDQGLFEANGFAAAQVDVWRDFRKDGLILRYLTHWDPKTGLSFEFNRHFELGANAASAVEKLNGAVAETLELVATLEQKLESLC